MLSNYILAMGLIMLVLLGWVSVQHVSRLFAKRHPQFGVAREEGGGCGKSCLCAGGGSCKTRD